MASFAMSSAKATSFTGKSVSVRAARSQAVKPARAMTVKAAKEGSYFDLDDMETTAGSWNMYGQDGEKRYPDLQADFFERSAAGLSRRESLVTFIAIGGAGATVVWGGKGSKDAKLPINVGPQAPPTPGPRGKI